MKNTYQYKNKIFNKLQYEQIQDGIKHKIDVSNYANPDFDENQMEEIKLALKDGVDTSNWAYPSIPWELMRIQRIAKVNNINLPLDKKVLSRSAHEYADQLVAQFLSTHTDCVREDFESHYQLSQIFLGLMEGVEVKKYAHPKYSVLEMSAIRKALKNGIDITPYIFHYPFHEMMPVSVLLIETLLKNKVPIKKEVN